MNEDLINRITYHLSSGGLFNPELADHLAVRNLLMECRDALAQPEQETQGYREAAQLAKWLFKTHYAQQEHYASGRVIWGLCDTTSGVISQIDNMVCKLVLPKEPEQEPVAWRTFDGEGGYEYRSYDMNEQYAQEWEQRNPKHKWWVEPLYTFPQPCPTCEALARTVMMDQTGRDA